MHRYYIIYKPFHVLSQFSSQEGKPTLKDFFDVPADVYPVGRLDFDSEGLLILTNDKSVNQQLLHPAAAHEREYLLQVEGDIDQAAIGQLLSGVQISVDGKTYLSRAKKAKKISNPSVQERIPPVRFRKSIPTSWISLTLTEGKNRQVRKMTAKIGFPTLRLLRTRIQGLNLEGMLPGDIVEMERQEMFHHLFGLDQKK